jgi:hypothetical protein
MRGAEASRAGHRGDDRADYHQRTASTEILYEQSSIQPTIRPLLVAWAWLKLRRGVWPNEW